MYLRRFNTQVLVLWACLAATVSAIAMTFMTKDLMLDSLAISVSVLTSLGVIFSGSLLLTERIIKTCNS